MQDTSSKEATTLSYGALNVCVTWKVTLSLCLIKGFLAAINVILKLE